MKIISPGELHKGQFVTVLSNKPYIKQEFNDNIPDFLLNNDDNQQSNIKTITNEDRSGYGEVMLIEAVMLPYIAVRYVNDSMLKDICIKYDTRRTQYMECSAEYVEAMKHR
jgi:hypothetical protein